MATEFISNSWLMPTNANAEANRVSNYSLDFDGSSQYISINSSILSAAGDMTVSAWVKFNDTTSLQGIFESANYYTTGFNGGFGLRANGVGLSAAFSNGTSFDYNIEPAGFTIGNWFHVAFTFNNTSKLGTYYVDGSAIGTYTFNSAYDNADLVNGAELGRVIKNSGFILNGNLTEVSIFDYSLSGSQVTELYGTGSAIGNPMAITNGRKPVAYYPLGNAAFNSEFLVPNSAVSDYVFDFSNDSIELSNISSISNVTEFSISAWINSDSITGSDKEIFTTADSTSEAIVLNLFNGDIIASVGTTSQFNRYNSAVSVGQWYHLVMVFNGSESTNADIIKLYKNGVLQTPSVTPPTLATTSPNITGNAFIGRWALANVAHFNGKISNVSLFNTSLPATGTESVESLYNYGTPPNIASYSNLQGWWELDASATFDGSNWSIPDASSNSNTGTSSGMTAANLILSDLVIKQSYDPFSLSFDGTNQHIDLTSDADLGINSTVSVWINSDIPIAALNDIILGYNSGYILYINNNFIYIFVDGNLQSFNHNSMVDGQWYNITVVRTGDSVEVFQNGVSLGTQTGYGTSVNTIFNTIGARSGGGFCFNGKISNVSAFNTSLSAAQVKTLYNEHKPFDLNTFAVTPTNWWRLGAVNSSFDGTNWTLLDEISTSGNNGVSENMTQADLVDGVGATGSGTSSGMGSGENRKGSAPFSENNAVSYNLSVTAKSTSTPT